ncbi:MAG: HIT family protein [Betaproteobacteria bacterium]|nr:HIT family protein [Betaproteobacteria bacterium]
MNAADCELCREPGGEVVWQDGLVRVVRVSDALHPAYCRVIWQRHVREMSDLPAAERRHFMALVFAAEVALRRLVRPDKINLASLGNMTPHLHWHVVARFADDPHFPDAIWAAARRPPRHAAAVPAREDLACAIAEALAEEQGGNG